MNSETIKMIHIYIKQMADLQRQNSTGFASAPKVLESFLQQSQIDKKNNTSLSNSFKPRKSRTETSLIYPNNYWIFDISEYNNIRNHQFKVSLE